MSIPNSQALDLHFLNFMRNVYLFCCKISLYCGQTSNFSAMQFSTNQISCDHQGCIHICRNAFRLADAHLFELIICNTHCVNCQVHNSAVEGELTLNWMQSPGTHMGFGLKSNTLSSCDVTITCLCIKLGQQLVGMGSFCFMKCSQLRAFLLQGFLGADVRAGTYPAAPKINSGHTREVPINIEPPCNF